MRAAAPLPLLAALALLRCGPSPAQAAGTYSGSQNLVVTGGAGELGSQVISVTQTGGDIAFTLSMCQVKASADSATSFHIGGFKCSKYLASQSWTLTGDGKVGLNANAISVSITGTGINGQVNAPFTWNFSGSRGL